MSQLITIHSPQVEEFDFLQEFIQCIATTPQFILNFINLMQDQLCVQIDISQNDHQSPKKALKIRNRRYKKLKELRQNGFFSQDSIKLRHPLLYHNYLGNHMQRSTATSVGQSTLSEFLHKNLLNLQYKAKLEEELKGQEGGKMDTQQGQNQKQMQGQLLFGQKQSHRNNQNAWQIVQQEEIELQEQNLIDHAQQLFLEGKVDSNYINYKDIDNNSEYDEINEENRDAQEQYFKEQDSQQDNQINLKYYTGIQDY